MMPLTTGTIIMFENKWFISNFYFVFQYGHNSTHYLYYHYDMFENKWLVFLSLFFYLFIYLFFRGPNFNFFFVFW